MTQNPPEPRPIVHAPGPPDFELHSLGWRAFQDLVGVVLREVWGQSVQTFADSNDGGRDGAFYGTWSPPDGPEPTVLRGPFVIQCKHTSGRDVTLTPSELVDEFDKIPTLVEQGRCTSYVLVTNARITGQSEAKIRERLAAAGVRHSLVFGSRWLNQTIAGSPALRALVPRVYGLGDLSQVLDARAYAQTQALLGHAREDLRAFIATDQYRRAAGMLESAGFVMLVGEPGAGKSLFAAALAVAAIDRWACRVTKPATAGELVSRWNVHEPGQLFWVDDAFGVVRHDRALTDSWARRMPEIMTAVAGGARVIMTSRAYIFQEAEALLKSYAYSPLSRRRAVFDVGDLSLEEKRQILYAHLRHGDQPIEIREAFAPHLDAVADVESFRPEIARRLGSRFYTTGLRATRTELVRFMALPTEFLQVVFAGLDPEHVAALALVYLASRLPMPLKLTDPQREVVERCGGTAPGVNVALRTLTGTFLRDDDATGWSFRHVTLRDGFAAFLGSRHDLVDVVLDGLPEVELPSSVAVGGAADVLVRIPPSLYPRLAERLRRAREREPGDNFHERFRFRLAWHRFFVDRCGRDFLNTYLEADPDFIARLIAVRSYLSFAPELPVLARLKREGLLEEKTRLALLDAIDRLAVETPDADWLDVPEVDFLFTESERQGILGSVRDGLIAGLNDVLHTWEWSLTDDADPQQHYAPLQEALARYSVELADDAEASRSLSRALARIDLLTASASESRMLLWRERDATEHSRSAFDDLAEG